MSVADAIRNRRSIRHYRNDPIPQETLDALLELALEAPSSWNVQDRSIVVVSDADGRAGLERAAHGQPHPREAPVLLVFVAETGKWRDDQHAVLAQARANQAWNEEFAELHATVRPLEFAGYERRGLLRENAIKNAMIAATYVLLAATEAGLASSPMNGWDEAEVKKVIGIDDRDDLAIAVLVALGYPAEQRRHPGRLPRPHSVFHERYGAIA